MRNKVAGGPVLLMIMCVALILWTSGCNIRNPLQADTELVIMVDDRLPPEVSSWLTHYEESAHVRLTVIEAAEHEPDFARRAERYAEIFAEIQPDVYLGNPYYYRQLAKEGLFLDLQALASQAYGDLTDFHAPVLEWLREQGGGDLLAVSPVFQSQALFYNRELFERFGIEPPQDRMSFGEILSLAGRFAGLTVDEEPVYGFYDGATGRAEQLVSLAQDISGVQFLNAANDRILFDTPEWSRIYEMTVAAYRSGAVPHDLAQDESAYTRFNQGRIAMMLGDSSLYKQLRDYNHSLQWGLVSQPIDSDNRQMGRLTSGWLAAIRADSPHKEEAWSFLEYLWSEDWRDTFTDTLTGLPVRLEDRREQLEPFFMLGYLQRGSNRVDKLPQSFFAELSRMRSELLARMIEGELQVTDGLRDMEARGQELLDQYDVSSSP